jgi:hypothetical protein
VLIHKGSADLIQQKLSRRAAKVYPRFSSEKSGTPINLVQAVVDFLFLNFQLLIA